MKTIYIDSEFKCHVTNDGTMTPVETMAFLGKCDVFIEGYRFIPVGETWIREDGEIFEGSVSFPWKDYDELDNAQREYEQQLLAEYKSAMSDYNSAMAEIETALGL